MAVAAKRTLCLHCSCATKHFGTQEHPTLARTIGDWVSNKKTNATGKSDQAACQWAFLSAMLSLQNRAVAEGGNAVVNIRSYYKKNELSNDTDFECGAGTFVAGLALKGTVVELE